MDGGVVGLILWVVTMFALYWVVRAAVKDAILDAARTREQEIARPAAVDRSA